MRVMASDDLLYNLYVARLLGGAGYIQWAHYLECQAEPGLDIQWFGFRRLEPVLLI